jgi:hypothetical protein
MCQEMVVIHVWKLNIPFRFLFFFSCIYLEAVWAVSYDSYFLKLFLFINLVGPRGGGEPVARPRTALRRETGATTRSKCSNS